MAPEIDVNNLKEMLTQIESLLILQLLQNGATPEQIETVLKVKNIYPSNINASFPIKKLKKKGVKEENE
ncbi:MAG: hypothetical protein Q7S06_00630 [Nanoarchaeota archaeon]|nr:hypothetical protein [Nanoarchaeota archaeon]